MDTRVLLWQDEGVEDLAGRLDVGMNSDEVERLARVVDEDQRPRRHLEDDRPLVVLPAMAITNLGSRPLSHVPDLP